MNTTGETLGEALPREIAWVRDELIPRYQAIGPSGQMAIWMMRRDLALADKVMIEGDLLGMIAAYESIKGYKG